MSTIDNNAAEAPTSKEEKFFGVSTVIKPKQGEEKLSTPEFDIEESDNDDVPAKKSAEKPPEKKLTAKEADDAELASYSESVQKRISKMRWQQGEIERERDTIKAERNEAFRVAETLHKQNQQYISTITSGEARLVSEIKQRSENAVAMAKKAYAEAYEKGDSAAIIEAQEAMINANAELRSANDYEADYKRRSTQPPQRTAPVQRTSPVQRQVPSVPRPTQEAASWADANPWFGDPEHADMTALAYGVHENLIRHKGIKPDTDEYFEAIDGAMRQRFPEYFSKDDGEGEPAPTSKKTPATVVGSAQKQAPLNKRKVVLHASQVRLAKRLGLTVEQYAAQLIKEGNL